MNNVHGFNSNGGGGGGGGGPSGGFGGFGGPMGGGGQGGSCTDQIKAWWSTVSVFTRILFWTSVATGIGGMLPGLSEITEFILIRPIYVMSGFQIWRIFTGTLYVMGIFGLLFGIFAYIPLAAQREREIGTVKAAAWWFLNSICVCVLFCILGLVCRPIFPLSYVMPLSGLWGLFMVELTIECNKNPEAPRMLCCLPCQFKSRQFPWVFVAFFNVFSLVLAGALQVGIIAGAIVGYLHTIDQLNWCMISDDRARSLERKLFNSCANHTKYVGINGSGSEVPSSGFPAPGTISNQPFQSSNPSGGASSGSGGNSSGAFQAFGGKGRALGSSDGPSTVSGDRYGHLYEEDNTLGLDDEEGRQIIP